MIFLLYKVLPDDMIVLAEPDPDDMVQAIAKAIHILPQIDPQDMHLRVSEFFFKKNCRCDTFTVCISLSLSTCISQMKNLYSWHDVAKRTEIVYDRALRCSDQNLLERLSRYASLKLLNLIGLSNRKI